MEREIKRERGRKTEKKIADPASVEIQHEIIMIAKVTAFT